MPHGSEQALRDAASNRILSIISFLYAFFALSGAVLLAALEDHHEKIERAAVIMDGAESQRAWELRHNIRAQSKADAAEGAAITERTSR